MNEAPRNLPGPPSRKELAITGRDREFLPAALEILETPTAPLSKILMATICLFFGAALVWSCFGQLEMHAVAPGKVEMIGHAKVIEPLDPGKVTAIHMADGARVKAGELLLELDPSEALADERAQKGAMASSLAEIARRGYAIELVRSIRAGDPERRNIASELAIATAGVRSATFWPAQILQAYRLRDQAVLTADLTALWDDVGNLDRQIGGKTATLQRLGMMIAIQEQTAQTFSQLVATRQQALDLHVGTKINLYQAKGELEQAQATLASDQGQLIETSAAVDELESGKLKALSQFIMDNENKLADAFRKADETRQALAKAAARLARTKLYSPIDGVVQQAAVTTVGQVVTTGQQLAVVAPSSGAFRVEALVDNEDIGFVKTGQEAAIKVDAFPFTRFGVLHGKVLTITSQAVDEQDAKRALANVVASANESNSAAPDGVQGQPEKFVFPVSVSLDENGIETGGAMIPLAPGMTVSVEVKTGTRRVISYLLSPLAKVASEAMKER